MRVPWVPGHPLIFDNGCQAPVLRKNLCANRPNLGWISEKISKFSLFWIQPSFLLGKMRMNPWIFWDGHPSSESPGASPAKVIYFHKTMRTLLMFKKVWIMQHYVAIFGKPLIILHCVYSGLHTLQMFTVKLHSLYFRN